MLCIEGGRLICPESGRDEVTDVLIDGEIIAGVGQGLAAKADRRINISGKVVFPGAVDLVVETNDPGDAHREDLASVAAAAQAGGFTTVLATPGTHPAVDNGSVAADILARARRLEGVRLLQAGALSTGCAGVELAEIGTLADGGCVAFSDGGHIIEDLIVLRNALDYARRFDLPILLRAGEPEMERNGSAHEGLVAMRLGLRGIPEAGEEIGVAKLIALARLTGARVHITHVSTRRSVEAITRAIDEGLAMSASTTIHHLALSDQAIDTHGYDPNFRFVPPLRDEANRRAILDAVRSHDWFSVTSDHQPRALAEKEHEFERAATGAIGLETALGATLQALEGDLSATVKALATRPAAVLGRAAAVRVDAPADLTIFDPSGSHSISIDGLRSKSHNTPFLGTTLPGRVIGTVCAGRPSASLGSLTES